MSQQPQLKPQKVITNASMGASIVSLITNVNLFSIFSYNLSWTGTPTGTFSVEVCNDYEPSPAGVLQSPAVAGNWVPLTLSTPVVAAGSADTAFIDIDITGAAWVRLKYTRSSGTGTLNATLAGKSA